MLAGGQQPVVRRVVVSRPASGVLEMSVVVGLGPRVHALALRFEREGSSYRAGPGRTALIPRRTASWDGWVCTAVEGSLSRAGTAVEAA